MASGKYSFIVEQGATTDFQIVYKDSDGVAVDLSGYTAAMQLRDSKGGSTLYATLTSSLGDTYTKTSGSAFLSLSGSNLTTDQVSGSIGVYIGHGVTNDFSFNEAYYDIEITNGQIRTRLLEGAIKLTKQVTTV
jgi:hypothetical protein